MPRYKLLIEYDGTFYAGWQRQDGPKTVQGAIEAAIKAFCAEEATLMTAGRTDAGVHARGAVAHVDLALHRPAAKICAALNAHLRLAGEAIVLLAAEQVGEDFNARFSAVKRHYLYRILNRRAPPALDNQRVWWVPYRLNAEKMHKAAQILLGRHDFTTFRAAQCQAQSPVRSLDRLDVWQEGEFIEIHAAAQSFLHNQIRSFAGSLVEVGRGKWSKRDLKQALEARDRARCGPVAPPHGLYLMQVDYA
ncbi:MAG: tRNA pseudouridine(38-40) synthase TruA [Candidatus Tokpelaia sp.]|nr:MAG: tRNA pseudouridine(38-40) synthase TruA [Candidatus Tokpelaia sp.]KAA6206818.1 MAG: tRNA pseudouridine(38-40) synthase TruA [Candidatus Tokpelaia sp.]